MKTLNSIFIVLMCLTLTVNCYIDEVLEDCFDEDLQLSIKNGESITPEGHCQRLTCFGNGFIHVETCRIAKRAGCKKYPVDLTKEYPMCCPHLECKDKAEIFDN